MYNKITRVIVQATTITLITFLLGEAVLRIYNYYKPSFIFYDGSYNWFKGKPHQRFFDFKFNSNGYLDTEFNYKKNKDMYRIIALGDSFTQGVVPYRYNWVTKLGEQLTITSKSVEVLNMGVPRTGPPDYLSLFKNEGLSLNPDTLLLAFFTGNDFIESEPIKRPLYSYSYMVALFYYAFIIRNKIDSISLYDDKNIYCDDCSTFDYITHANIEAQRSTIFIEGNDQFTQLCDTALLSLKKINDICINKGIKLVIVIFPDEIQINNKLQSDISKKYFPDVPPSSWNMSLPNRILSQKLDNLGIDNLDLYPYFLKESSKQILYKPRDTHFNIAGNKLAADVISTYIRGILYKELHPPRQ